MVIMYKKFLVIVVLTLFSSLCHTQKTPIINITGQGKVQGKLDADRNGRIFNSFQGIPYAAPPVGNLRFKRPVEHNGWNETLSTTEEKNICPQRLLYSKKHIGNEDCLYLNVYTPDVSEERLYPVMVWIHGGSFVEGSGNTNIHGPQNLMTEDIVLVTINYRLGILGYLALDDASLDITGNMAHKDQLLALDWVKKHIHQFGGDATKVTLAGNSAGAVSVDLIMLSDKAKHNFHRAMVQSGCVSAYWAMASKFHRELAEVLNLKKNISDVELYEELKKLPVERLINAQILLSGEQNVMAKIGPIIEDPNSPQPLITKPPSEIIKKGEYTKVPYLTGFTDQEAMFQILYMTPGGQQLPETAKDLEKILPKDMNLIIGSEKSKSISKQAMTFYFRDQKPTMEDFFALSSDIGFVYPINRQVRMLSQHLDPSPSSTTQMFYYLFTLDTEINMFKRQTNLTNVYKGAAHTDEKGYLFNYEGAPVITPGSNIDKYVKQMVTFWSNFVKYGTPEHSSSPKWIRVQKDQLNYMNLGETLQVGINPFKDRVKFWDDMYEEAYRSSASLQSISIILIVSGILLQFLK